MIKQKNNAGYTLVEIILAMAILAIVVTLMVPVLLSGFRQIVLNGERSKTIKQAVGNMEVDLASGIIPTDNDTYTIDISNGMGISVAAYQLSQEAAGLNGDVSLSGYIPPDMPVVSSAPNPTPTPLPTPTPTPTPLPTPTPEISPEPPEPTAVVTPTISPTPMPTSAPPIDMVSVAVSVNPWTLTNRNAQLLGTNSLMEYMILENGVVSSPWVICLPGTSGIINVSLSNPESRYEIVVRQISNTSVFRSFLVRAAPSISVIPVSGKYQFHVRDPITGAYRRVVTEDHIQYFTSGSANASPPSSGWIPVSSSTQLNNLNMHRPATARIYFRYYSSSYAEGTTVDDPPSLYQQRYP